MRRLSSFLTFTFILLTFTACQSLSPNTWRSLDAEELPLTPGVYQGQLDNGIHYYFQPNPKPQNKAFITLLVKVGSLQEADGEEGIAHFVEHMAFNGTEHFDKNSLITSLESMGMAFGSDINAFTSQQSTRYHLEIPSDDEANWKTAQLILSDWITAITFEPNEVEKERQVILSEKRTYQGLSERLQKLLYPINYGDSVFAKKHPIGTEQSLALIDAQKLKAFHQKWYHSDNLAIIVTGDIKPQTLYKKLNKSLGQIEFKSQAKPQEFASPELAPNQYLLIQDLELLQNTVQLKFKAPATVLNNKTSLKERFLNSAIVTLFNNRIGELAEKADRPFESASLAQSSLTQQDNLFSFLLYPSDDKYLKGYERLLAEINRIERQGFLQSEWQRYVDSVLKSSRLSLLETGNQNSANLTSDLMNHFLYGEHYLSRLQKDMLMNQMLPQINVAEVNQHFSKLTQRPVHSIVVYGPEELPIDTQQQEQLEQTLFDSWYSRNQVASLDDYQEKGLEQELLTELPIAGTILTETAIEQVDSFKYELSNGATVILRPSDLSQTELLVSAYAPGGFSLASLEEQRSAMQAPYLVAGSGIGPYSRVELGKKLAGKSVNLNLSIGRFFSNLNASSTPQESKTLLELIHLYFSQPKMDPQVVANHKASILQYQQNRLNDPEERFADELHLLLNNNHPFSQPWSANNAQNIDAKHALEFYQQRFSRIENFTFIITGSFAKEDMESLVNQYIASLPAGSGKERWLNRKIYSQEKDIEFIREDSLDEKTKINLHFHKPINKYISGSRLALSFYQDLLKKRLEDELREELGGVYSIGVSADITRVPVNWFNLNISFNCDPAREAELLEAVENIIEDTLNQPLSEAHIASLKKQFKTSFEDSKLSNKFWLSRIYFYERDKLDYNYLLEYLDKLEAVKAQDIQSNANRLLEDSYKVRSILRPKKEY